MFGIKRREAQLAEQLRLPNMDRKQGKGIGVGRQAGAQTDRRFARTRRGAQA